MAFNYYALKLCGILILIFLGQSIAPEITELFVLTENGLTQPWRLVSSIFLHGGLAHLALNTFALGLFGSILEKFIGEKKLLTVFFVSGILANIVSLNFYNSSLGASGAIFGVLGALVVMRPLMTVWAFGLPMPMFIAGILWGISDVFGALGFLSGAPLDNTGNIAHLSGMFFGLLFGVTYRNEIKKRGMGKGKKERFVLDERTIQNWENHYMRSN